MNRLLERALIFAIGAVAGGLPTFFVTKKVCNKKHDKEFDELDQYYKTEFEELSKKIPATGHEEIKEPEVHTDRREAEKSRIERSSIDISSRERAARHVRTDYASMYKSHSIDPADTEHPEDDPPESDQGEYLTRELRDNEGRAPAFINAADYGQEPGYTRQTLCYYIGNDVLTIEEDQDEEIIKDFDEVESLIGDALDRYGFKCNEEDTIYIRNYRRQTDYQIIKVYGAYRGT